jgi:4-amino-4-deoxy-L-arabinose transferase-like glycosyltransferase
VSREDLKGFRVPTLIAILSFAYVLAISWGVSPAADGYRYLSAARYVADTGNLLGEWPHTHINPASFREPRLGIALLSLAYMAGGEAGSRILLAAFAALCVYPAYLILSALTDRRMALLGSALWVFVPVNIIWTSFFYIDLIAAFFGYLGLWGLIKIDSDEGGWKPLAVFTAAMFSISIMCRRTSIIYVFLLSATLVSSAVLRRKAGRVLRVGVILALVLLASAIWVPDYVSSGFREYQRVEPSLSHLPDAKLWAGQFLGVFSQVSGQGAVMKLCSKASKSLIDSRYPVPIP